MTTAMMASSDTSTTPRFSSPSNRTHASAGSGPARELSDFTAECRDSERRTITTTVSGSVISKPVGGTVQVSRNPAVVQILATSALASSSVRGTTPATSIKWMRRA